MKENKVSIVVPVYNKQKQIKRCLNSLINQTYKNLEIIVIDDGSTDKSYEICKRYENKDKRIKVIKKINEGVDIARHTGIKHCTGEYITFVDSDDSLSKDAIELLVEALEKKNADIVFGNYERVIGKLGLIKKRRQQGIYQDKTILHNEFIDVHLKSFCGWGEIPVTMWGKLYKRKLFKNITPTRLKYGEDLCFNLQVMPKANKIVSIPNFIYKYSWGGVTSNIDENRILDDAIKQYQYKTEVYKKYNKLDFIEMANIELFNYFINYVDAVIEKYPPNVSYEKIKNILNLPIIHEAYKGITFDRLLNDEKYKVIKDKNIEKLLVLRSKMVKRNKIKKYFMKVLNLI